MSAEAVYLDSSALVKLVVAEQESPALARYLGRRAVRVSSALARVEVTRAVRAHGEAALVRAGQVLGAVDLLGLDDPLLEVAASLDGTHLRSLDAIHLAAALALGDDLAQLVTYDHRMADHAAALGLDVVAPG